MASSVDYSYDNLPSDPWLHILSYMEDFKDLLNCSRVSKRIHELCQHNSHWKKLCKKYWLESECPEELSWKDNFILWYCNFGRYVHCYSKIIKTWAQIKEFMKESCPQIYNSIKDGLSEEELDAFEAKINCKLPDDLRCSYRINNGQVLTSPGLFGSISVYDHYRTESLLDLETATLSLNYLTGEGLKNCIPITMCTNSGISQYIALTDEDGHQKSEMFYIVGQSSTAFDFFISGKDFSSWLAEYGNNLCNNTFSVVNEQPYRFHNDPECYAITGSTGIKVSVATCFLPEMSSINPPKFCHTYKITMSMDANVSAQHSCQLKTRHWIITDETGHEERVDGPGVIGEYPKLVPGCTYSYESCVHFKTTFGNMRGSFTFYNLKTGKELEVECPIFRMKCLPYKTREDIQRRKQEIDDF